MLPEKVFVTGLAQPLPRSEGKGKGHSRAKAALSVDPSSRQGREKAGTAPTRPAELGEASVPREQTCEQAAALCPAVWRAVTHPAAALEPIQDTGVPVPGHWCASVWGVSPAGKAAL